MFLAGIRLAEECCLLCHGQLCADRLVAGSFLQLVSVNFLRLPILLVDILLFFLQGYEVSELEQRIEQWSVHGTGAFNFALPSFIHLFSQ